MPLPLGLRHALESGDCVLFVGAGVGGYLRDADGRSAPAASDLARELADHFLPDYPGLDDLPMVAQLVDQRKGRAELQNFIKRRLNGLTPDDPVRFLATLRWQAIYTTNYDFGLERAYELNPRPPQLAVPISATAELRSFNPVTEVPIYHVHGTVFGEAESRILITQDDYAMFRDRRKMLFEQLKIELARSTFIYVGYSNRDPNWRQLLEELRAEFMPRELPRSYRIARDTPRPEAEILRAKGIESIGLDLAQFQSAVELEVKQQDFDASSLTRLAAAVPSDLVATFQKSPAAVARLLSSWEYVNQAPFAGAPNVQAFLRGDLPNWALIASRGFFQRDIEEEVYDHMLDFATGASQRPSVALVLGPAGYGTTTVLMALAARLVEENAGPAYFHRLGTQLLEGDLEFAADLFPDQRPFFVIDNGADNARDLKTIVQGFRDRRRPAMFLIGARLNEWRAEDVRIGAREHLMESLTAPEVSRLLTLLEAHGELGVLADLPLHLRQSIVESKHASELLVVMREATEGRGFDAILEDEFRGLPNEFAQRAYLAVCCFFQHRALTRDTLLASLLGVDVPELYERLRGCTDGVILFETVDPLRGHEAARARHSKIASIVWDRCGSQSEREEILLSSLSSLNFGFKSDRDAFEWFFRSDRLVDSIRALEGRTKYFEIACQKDPENAFVRQHFARMLLRDDRLELALSQIERGIQLAPHAVVLRHTKGLVLSSLAVTAGSPQIARRRLAQAEDEFRRCIAARPRDPFPYQSLAELYLDWAKKSGSPEEAAEYLAKAEGVIGDGLRSVRIKEGLYVVSSLIEMFAGDTPAQVAALEKAVSVGSEGVVPRYLLASTRRRLGQPRQAVEVLEPVIRRSPEEYRCVMEYVLALLDTGAPFREALAVARLATATGLGDPRFVALLGGLLFLVGEFSEASRVFQESIRREFAADEARRVRFKPRSPADPSGSFLLVGRVVEARAGYALIEVADYPRVTLRASKFRGVVVRKGLTLEFRLVFCAQGALAEEPRVVASS